MSWFHRTVTRIGLVASLSIAAASQAAPGSAERPPAASPVAQPLAPPTAANVAAAATDTMGEQPATRGATPPPPVVPPAASAPAWSLHAGSPLAAKPLVDIPLTLGLGAVLLGAELVAPQLPGPGCGPVCDATTINALDRTVVGMHSSAARAASNVMIGVNIALPLVFDLIDVAVTRPPHAVSGYLQDALILTEVFVVNAAVNTAFKYAVRRPRPFMYEPAPGPGVDPGVAPLDERQDVDAGLSFYSQHSSTAFSLATAYSYLFMLRHPGSRLIVPMWIVSEGLAATTAVLRVAAGMHFYTDILIGAVAGSAIGLLIPFAHRRSLPAITAVAQSPWLRSLRVSAAPMLAADGGGLTLSFESP